MNVLSYAKDILRKITRLYLGPHIYGPSGSHFE